MGLLFGNLTQDFVNFAVILNRANGGDATAAAEIPQAAQNFRDVAGKDALYLVFIGGYCVLILGTRR